jgi:hypothetical protein
MENAPLQPMPITPEAPQHSNFLKTFFLIIALILFGVLLGVLAARFVPMSTFSNLFPSLFPTVTPTITPAPTLEVTVTPSTTPPEIIISEPATLSAVKSPLKIIGTAPKGWTFEGILSIIIEDSQHQKIAGGSILTKEIAGSNNLVSFETSLPFSTKVTSGFLTIKNDNPSGLPENDKSFSLPITFGTTASTIKYSCPSGGWIDCMPILDEAKKISCSAEAMTWYKTNCPNFKGAAL